MTKLRQVREKIGLSRMRVSKLAGIDYSTMCKLEKGEMRLYPGWRKRIAQALNVKESDLE
ncbi:MAG: helix-turn-helix domain-containing protein [Moorellaceae bacterium]